MTNEIRAAWARIETVHAVTYFAEECRAVSREHGLRGFWMGYFACRAAPMGTASAQQVVDAFYSFAPQMVARSIPEAWTIVAPPTLLDARAGAAATALRRLVDEIERVADRVTSILRGRELPVDTELPLYSGNRAVPLPEDPVARLWQQCTTVREHRGDSHVAALRAVGIDGCEALVLFAADTGIPHTVLSDNRGWSAQEWSAAAARLHARGLLDARGAITDAGRRTRADVERLTDAATAAILGDVAGALVDVLTPAAVAIAERNAIPYPNPIGLPAVRRS